MRYLTEGIFLLTLYCALFSWWGSYISGRIWNRVERDGGFGAQSFMWLGTCCSALGWTSAIALSFMGSICLLSDVFNNVSPQEMKAAWKLLAEGGTSIAVLSPVLGVALSGLAYALVTPSYPSSSDDSGFWHWWWWNTHTHSSSCSSSSSYSGGSSGSWSGSSGGSFDLDLGGDDAAPLAVFMFVAVMVAAALGCGIYLHVQLLRYHARQLDGAPARVRRAYTE